MFCMCVLSRFQSKHAVKYYILSKFDLLKTFNEMKNRNRFTVFYKHIFTRIHPYIRIQFTYKQTNTHTYAHTSKRNSICFHTTQCNSQLPETKFFLFVYIRNLHLLLAFHISLYYLLFTADALSL